MPTGRALRLGVFVFVSLVTRGPLLGVEVVAGDEAIHLLGGRTLLEGGRLYVDFVDNKPPLNHVFFALGDLAGGMLGVHLLLVLAVVPLTALGLSAFFGHDRRGFAAGILWLLYSAAWRADEFHAANSELLLLLPAVWALALLADGTRLDEPWRPFAAGALLGVAALFKPQAAAWLLAAAAATAFLPRGRARPIALMVGGFLAPLLATACVFAAQGTLRELIYWNVDYNAAYSANPVPPGEAIARAARTFVMAALFAPMLAVLPRSLPLLSRHARRLLVVALLATFPLVSVGLRFFWHYFLLFVPLLALAAAPAAVILVRRLGHPLAVLFCAWPLMAATAACVYNVTRWTDPGGVDSTNPTWSAVARRVAGDRCAAGATLFVWGMKPILYPLSGLSPASRFVVPQGTIAGYLAGNEAVQQGRVSARQFIRDDHRALLLADLERNRVGYLIDLSPSGIDGWQHFPMDGWPALRAYVDRELEWIDAIDGVQIYRRRGCAAAIR